MVAQKEMLKKIEGHRKDFFNLLKRAENVEPGTWGLKKGVWEFEVSECLVIGEYLCGEPEVAVVADNRGRIIAVPEDRKYSSENSLTSRWDVLPGLKLRIMLGNDGIPGVLVLN